MAPLQLKAQQGQRMSKIRLIQSMQSVGYAKVELIMKELLIWQGLNKIELLEFIQNLKKRPQLIDEFPNPSAEIILTSLKKIKLSPVFDHEIIEFLKDMVGLAGRNAHNRHELIYYLGQNRLWEPKDLDLVLSLFILAKENGGGKRLDGFYPLLRDLKDFADKQQLQRAISALELTQFNSLSKSLILFRAGQRSPHQISGLVQLFINDYADTLLGKTIDHVSIEFGDYDEALSDLSRIFFEDNTFVGKTLRETINSKMSYLKKNKRGDKFVFHHYRLEALIKLTQGHFLITQFQSQPIMCQNAFGF
jgi:hypothetical protein